MAEEAPAPAPSMTREEWHAEAELQMRDIDQRFGTLPQDKDELLGLLVVSAAPYNSSAFAMPIISVPVIFIGRVLERVSSGLPSIPSLNLQSLRLLGTDYEVFSSLLLIYLRITGNVALLIDYGWNCLFVCIGRGSLVA